MANQQQREDFLKLLHAIDQVNHDALTFTLAECETDFLHGEEELALETLIDNLYEVRFPLTDELYQSIARLAHECGLPPTSWLILQQLL